ncbi:PRMT5 arginine-N-methyltransferase-domain-containing protein [Pelagophyceae sp. CCMP2097]|nr:PRMT5 arginine-N-methyltransferase-domain-containing protein [Pelagophyceae sp. CCMP2097]
MVQFTLGAELLCVPDVRLSLHEARAEGFDFVAAPLVHPRLRRDARGVSDKRQAPLTRSDLLLSSAEWSRLFVGLLSPWAFADLDGGAPDEIRRGAELALQRELTWASHLSLAAVLVPPLCQAPVHAARLINEALMHATSWQVWVRCPLTARAGEGDSWDSWDAVRRLCSHSIALAVALEMTHALPSKDAARRWRGEPIKCIFIPTSLFVENEGGFPVLPKQHQDLLLSLAKLEPQLVLTGRPKHVRGRAVYAQYLQHLAKKKLPEPSMSEAIEKPYRDYLQSPLQPLGDNLESSTYETFERDPVKYAQYQEAVRRLLVDTTIEATANALEAPVTASSAVSAVVMVVGAGRGPLVKCVLRAAAEARRTVRVYAVEKNVNAVITLRGLVRSEPTWAGVTVVEQDMRLWNAPELADLLVSELLGSFGDNELSPECLDGAQKCLKPGGRSVPSRYEAFASPVACARLWADARRAPGTPAAASAQCLSPGAPPPPLGLETPFVVKLHNHAPLAAPQPVFAFEHPNANHGAGDVVDNTRHSSLRFQLALDATVHGLAGYFEATLYEDVIISINPPTNSTGMFSWFPLFIPFLEPVRVSAGEALDVQLWRRGDDKRVWYEWAVTSPRFLPIQNPNGRSSAIHM